MSDDLASRGYTAEWLAAQDEGVRHTVALLHEKLVALDLWRFVVREWATKRGRLQFVCDDVPGLKQRVVELGFTKPRAGPGWSASERRARLSLHLKHFEGWDDDKVQAHVDLAGAWLPRRWWWFPPVPLAQLVHHLFHYESYLDVERLRALMRAERGGPA